jgi:hypothetical protein
MIAVSPAGSGVAAEKFSGRESNSRETKKRKNLNRSATQIVQMPMRDHRLGFYLD